MKDKILYSLSLNLGYHIMWIIILLIISISFLWAAKKEFENKNILTSIFVLFLIICALVGTVEIVIEDIVICKKYYFKQYDIVEGEITSFVPGTYDDKKSEKFYINDVYFDYCKNDIRCGYNKIQRAGGVIKGDGQKLKIGYVYWKYRVAGNRIVYIEEIE